jgi:erythromycin esterase
MAETVRWHLEHSAPGTRVVLAAHNNHIQKTANEFAGAITALPMGQHLARMLGEDYVAIAATQSASMHTPLPDAFDAVISTPTVTRDHTVKF